MSNEWIYLNHACVLIRAHGGIGSAGTRAFISHLFWLCQAVVALASLEAASS